MARNILTFAKVLQYGYESTYVPSKVPLKVLSYDTFVPSYEGIYLPTNESTKVLSYLRRYYTFEYNVVLSKVWPPSKIIGLVVLSYFRTEVRKYSTEL